MASGALEQAEARRIRAQLAGAFNPGGPVSRIDLLVGRLDQINEVFSAVQQRGLSVLLFGERGVGKTSLASLIHELWTQYYADPESVVALRTNCTPSSTFESIWSNIAELMQDVYDRRGESFPSGDSWTEIFTEIRNEAATPHNVRRLLTLADKRFIIVIDEFDQITDEECAQLFASTVKELSDYLADTTLILVGVADTVDDLIADHASIDRAAVQVSLPRMPVGELRDIIARGYQAVGLACADSLLETNGATRTGLAPLCAQAWTGSRLRRRRSRQLEGGPARPRARHRACDHAHAREHSGQLSRGGDNQSPRQPLRNCATGVCARSGRRFGVLRRSGRAGATQDHIRAEL